MGQSSRPEAPYLFSQPLRQIVLMLIVLGLVVFGVYVTLPQILPVFKANLYLNGFIGGVFLIGVIACFLQIGQIVLSVNWIERFTGILPPKDHERAPRLLAPLASILRGREKRLKISPTSSRSILDSVAIRIDEVRDITRYISNVLIFLGLLGTFYGLATTVPALVETIRSLAPSEGEEPTALFTRLMGGLESQLDGMGTAFASSLLGLAGSLVVSLLELFVSHGQNRFYRELEEWMSSFTRISAASDEASAGAGEAAGVLEYMSEELDEINDLFTRSEAARSGLDERMGTLIGSVEALMKHLEKNDQTNEKLTQIAQGQEKVIELLTVQAEASKPAAEDKVHNIRLDDESRMRLRSMDVQLLRIIEELAIERHQSMQALQGEMANVAQILREVIEQDQQDGAA